MVFRFLIVIHRWLGVSLCLLFLLWFPSGIGMMYWGMPAVTEPMRLDRWPALEAAKVVLSPQEAAERAFANVPLNQVRLNSFDGRPAYRFGNRVLYADTGEEQWTVSSQIRDRAAEAWTGLPVTDAVVDSVTEIDQWMVGNQLQNLRPLWKYVWPNGEQVYIGESGDVLQYTTTRSRFLAYISAVPHWLYFTPLRKHQPIWIRFATYAAMVGTVGAIIGVVVGVGLYSPRKKKYRSPRGMPSSVPYRGQKRLHTVLGLIFGVATVTWTFSGSLAFLPFPTPQPAPATRAQLQARPSPGDGGGGRRGHPGLAAALRGRSALEDFARLHPRDLLARYAELPIKEIAFTSFDDEPLYVAKLSDGASFLISLAGDRVDHLDRARIVEIVKGAAADPEKVEARLVEQYDMYYLDRTRGQPLPVILALMNDAEKTRHYIDPKTAAVVHTYSSRNAWRRWAYSGLHSFNFPWLYNYRPLWDIVVITFMLGGTALGCTALVLAWRVVGEKLRSISKRAPELNLERPRGAPAS
jgi:hypothetical protein